MKIAVYLTVFMAFFLFLLYAGMTESLCQNIESFSEKEQSDMQLSRETCNLEWYKRL